jgi:hypothetical protein
MASKPVFLGNITAIFLTLLASLQILPWSLIGPMILATLILPLLFSRQSNNSGTTPEPKTHRQHHPETATIHNNPTSAGSAPKTSPLQDNARDMLAKAIAPKQDPPRPEVVRMENTPSQKASLTKPVAPIPGPEITPIENSAIIPEGDYEKYEVNLKEGDELVSEVKATGMVNVYLLDQDNLTSLYMARNFGTKPERNQYKTPRFTLQHPRKESGTLLSRTPTSKK